MKKTKINPLSNLEKVHGRIPKLEIGDIVLIHHKKNIARYYLRKAIGSYWDHAVMIIMPKDYKGYFKTDLIIESFDQTVMIHRLAKYLNDPSKYDIGIKRFSFLTEDIKERISAFALLNVDAPYYSWSGLKFFIASLSKTYKENLLRSQRYSCTSLVQKAFYEAVDWKDKEKVVFKQFARSPLEIETLTTPGEIAKSDKCEWIYNKHY